jgi:rhodanese-related sulfurtransferase
MGIFRRGTGGPGRVTVQQAAVRTGHAGGGGDAVLLDVREPYEWQAGHAPRAVYLSLSALAAGAELPSEAQSPPLIVICRSGNRSRQAAQLLVARGARAVDVVGGMRDWAEAGLPVVDARGENGTIA